MWCKSLQQHGEGDLHLALIRHMSDDAAEEDAAWYMRRRPVRRQQASAQTVQLETAQAGSLGTSASVAVPIANQGNTSLAVAFSLERRNASVLVPGQWLDPSSGYEQLFSGLQGSCGSGQVCCRACLCTCIALREGCRQ